ncbi:MAG: YtxH domain-containing protein [Thermomicrobiales bacterium]
MADVDIRELRDTAARRAKQQLDHLDLPSRAKQQLDHLDLSNRAKQQLGNVDLSGITSHLPKNMNVDWDLIQQREDRAATRGFLGGFLLGALLGAVLALVFAPRRGAETRETIAHAAGDVKDKATSLVGQAKDDSSDLASNVSDFRAKAEEKSADGSAPADIAGNANVFGEPVQDKFSDAKDNADDLAEKAHLTAEDAKQSLKSVLDEAKAKSES